MAQILVFQNPSPGHKAPLSIDIPQEVIDLFINIICANNKKDLAACALVSKSFHASTCRHLFSAVEIVYECSSWRWRAPDAERRMCALRKLLEASPDLVSYIKILSIRVDPRRNNQKRKLLSLREPARRFVGYISAATISSNTGTGWGVNKQASIAWVLDHLSSHARLRSLSIAGPDHEPMKWDEFPFHADNRIPALLLTIAQSHPHLQRLSLFDIYDIPSSILARKPNGGPIDLSLAQCRFQPSGRPIFSFGPLVSSGSSGSHSKPALGIQNINSLSLENPSLVDFFDPDVLSGSQLEGSSMAVEKFPSPVAPPPALLFSKLELLVLTLEFDSKTFVILGRLLTSDAPVLRKLRLWTDKLLPEQSGEPLELYKTPTQAHIDTLVPLKDLELSIYLIPNLKPRSTSRGPGPQLETPQSIRAYYQRAFASLAQILKYPLLPATIERLRIQLSLLISIPGPRHSDIPGRYDPTPGQALSDLQYGLRAVDEVLSNPARFGKLENVKLEVDIHVLPDGIQVERELEGLKEWERRGVLQLPRVQCEGGKVVVDGSVLMFPVEVVR